MLQNEKSITGSGTADQVNITALASNNGVLCGTNSVILTASGTTSSIVWFHNGVEYTGGKTITISGDNNIGEWFAATKSGTCYSKPSNSITVTKSEASGQINLPSADVLVNGVPLSSFNSFCAGGSLDLSVANKQNGITYMWYNGNDAISSNPFIVPASQSTISLRLVATDNSGSKCAAEANAIEKSITTGSTPGQPNITSPTNGTICGGSANLTLVPAVAGTYTYTWYKDGVKMSENTQTITITTPGVVYTGSVTNATGCTSSLATKAIPAEGSSLPVLSWLSKQPDSAAYGTIATVQVKLDGGSASSYTWTIDKGALFTANNAATYTGPGQTVSIALPASGIEGDNLNIKVKAQNSCGSSVELPGVITMNNSCPTPVVVAVSSQKQGVTQDSNVQVAISTTNGTTSSPTYQWYSSATESTTGGTSIIGATSPTYSFIASNLGVSYVYCIVTNGCVGNKTGISPLFTIITATNPENITPGSGSLSGRTCFDIAETEGGTSCGSVTSRSATRADFTTNIYKQNYVFTPQGTVSNVRFDYVESVGSGLIVDKFSYKGYTATVEFKKALSGSQGSAKGKDRQNALTLDIYAIFNDGKGDKRVKLSVKIQDCMCCGAKVTPTQWKEFMCYNLGVTNQSLDPFTPNPGLVGTYITNQTFGENGIKSANDPCPPGYRIPTKDEWDGVIQYNARTLKGVSTKGNGGIQFGEALMLPNSYGLTTAGGNLVWFAHRSASQNYFIRNGGWTTNLSISSYYMTKDAYNARCISEN